MQRVYARLASLLTILAVTGFVFTISAGQATAASSSLGVNPRRDYTIKPGESLNDTLYVSNLSRTDDLYITIQIVDFGPKDETGSPALLLGQKDPAPWSLKPYLTIAKSVSVSAGKSVTIPFTISIPAKVGAGSYYGAIKYSTAGEETNNSLNLTSSSATLVFVRVPGEAHDSLVLKKFGAFTPTTDGKSGSFGTFYGGAPPRYLAYRLNNAGNVADQPTGSVVLKNMFGKQVKLFDNANPNKNTVLIGQTRRIDLCLNSQTANKANATGQTVEEVKCDDPALRPGRYTAELVLLYGENGGSSHELREVASFWYLPLWFIIAVVIGLTAIAGLVWWVVRKIRARRFRAGKRR